MPELPEVETVRRGLEIEAVGRLLVGVRATGARTVRRHPEGTATFGAGLAGGTVVAVERTGKYLGIVLDRPVVAVVHLGMSGQLLWEPAGRPAARHTHVVFAFEGGEEARFVDPRTFGEVFLTDRGPQRWPPPALSHLGFDPLVSPPGQAAFARMLSARRTRLKALLMDQRFVAGIGNIYSDEILFAARLRPDRTAAALSAAEARRLHRAMLEVLAAAVELGGSSLADQQYRDLYGRVGRAQQRHRVYDRAGLPCPRCGATIERVRHGGRHAHFCPRCQV